MRGGDRPIYGGVQPCTGDGCGRPVMGEGLCDVCLGHVAPPAPVAKSAEVVGSGPVQTAAMQEAFRDERWRHTGTIAPPPFPSPAPVDLTAEERESLRQCVIDCTHVVENDMFLGVGSADDTPDVLMTWLREHGFRIVREG